jgi:hypothetical protein
VPDPLSIINNLLSFTTMSWLIGGYIPLAIFLKQCNDNLNSCHAQNVQERKNNMESILKNNELFNQYVEQDIKHRDQNKQIKYLHFSYILLIIFIVISAVLQYYTITPFYIWIAFEFTVLIAFIFAANLCMVVSRYIHSPIPLK